MKIHSLILAGGLLLPSMLPATSLAPYNLYTQQTTTDNTVTKDYETRISQLQAPAYFSIFKKDLTADQRKALQFLYAYMPLPDLTDYSGDFYLKNVDYTLRARSEMPWGKQIPEREFLHFVLPIRVNNENMDESRAVFYEELKDRVRGLSMYNAVLEVNHWCHEKVTYKPSDSRTSSPLASVRTAYGRCGEESTFTVAALRAVGIPARQVYTPRWAHTDDNHAWVEAWVDGKWYFLGACEPEPVLNLGWFNAPASRGILMHTKAFGRYNGPEEIMSTTPCYTEINVTENYAPVSRITVRVVDEKGRAVPHAPVSFKLYNYAEFYTVARKETDANGLANLTAGRGDLLAWASNGKQFGFSKCSVGTDKEITIRLNKTGSYADTLSLDVTPPAERNTLPQLSETQISENQRRIAYEDSLRNAYVKTFATTEQSEKLATELNLDPTDVTNVLKASRGNHQTLTEFLQKVPSTQRQRALCLLQVISEKDRRDVPADVLQDHLTTIRVETPLYDEYVLNPRISNELLTPYKQFFTTQISEKTAQTYRLQPALWAEWCRKNIHIDEKWNPQKLCMSPQSVWTLRKTDAHSLAIFFVAAARSMGIPARIDEVTGKTQYANKTGEWTDANLKQDITPQKQQAQGTWQASYTQTGRLDNPKYYTHFSVSKLVDGEPQLLNYPENATWKQLLKDGTPLDEGQYLLVSGQRMANGSVLTHLTFFPMQAQKQTNTPLVMRESKDGVQVIGNFNAENLYCDLTTKQTKSLLSTTGRGYYIIGLVTPNHEPTNHALNDIAACQKELEQWGHSIILLFANQEEAGRFNRDEFKGLPSTLHFGTDVNNAISKEIREGMKLTNNNKPIFLIADTFNRVVYLSQGYTIGLGEQLLKIIHKLSE